MRLRSHVPVRYQELRTSRLVETLSKDVGEGGLQCLTSEFLPASSELMVELSLRRGAPVAKARARVAWIQQLPHTDQYCLGLEFLYVPDPMRSAIHAYLATAANRSGHPQA